MLTGLAFVVASVRVGEPIGSVLGVSMMRLVKTRFINGFRRNCSKLNNMIDIQQLYC